MKRIRFLGLLLLLSGLTFTARAQDGQANAIDKYFSQYVDDPNFDVVFISPKLFQLIGKLDKESVNMEDDDDVQAFMDMAEDMRGLRILTTDINPKQYYKEAKNKINTKEYEILMTVRSRGGSNVEFLVLEEADKIRELLLISGGDDEFMLLSFIGNLDLDKISKLANEIEH